MTNAISITILANAILHHTTPDITHLDTTEALRENWNGSRGFVELVAHQKTARNTHAEPNPVSKPIATRELRYANRYRRTTETWAPNGYHRSYSREYMYWSQDTPHRTSIPREGQSKVFCGASITARQEKRAFKSVTDAFAKYSARPAEMKIMKSQPSCSRMQLGFESEMFFFECVIQYTVPERRNIWGRTVDHLRIVCRLRH